MILKQKEWVGRNRKGQIKYRATLKESSIGRGLPFPCFAIMLDTSLPGKPTTTHEIATGIIGRDKADRRFAQYCKTQSEAWNPVK